MTHWILYCIASWEGELPRIVCVEAAMVYTITMALRQLCVQHFRLEAADMYRSEFCRLYS